MRLSICPGGGGIVHQWCQVDAINLGVLSGNELITWHDAPLPTFWRPPPRFNPWRGFFCARVGAGVSAVTRGSDGASPSRSGFDPVEEEDGDGAEEEDGEPGHHGGPLR